MLYFLILPNWLQFANLISDLSESFQIINCFQRFHELQSLFLFRSCTVLTICYRRGQESVLCAHCRSKSGKPGFTETAWRGRESGDPPSSILRQALSGHHTTPCSLSAYAKVQLLNRCYISVIWKTSWNKGGVCNHEISFRVLSSIKA